MFSLRLRQAARAAPRAAVTRRAASGRAATVMADLGLSSEPMGVFDGTWAHGEGSEMLVSRNPTT